MSLDISSLTSSAYGLNSNTSVDADKLKNNLANIDKENDEELMNVCKEFETYMIEQVIKSMEATIMKDEEESSTSYAEMFSDKKTTAYAEAISNQGTIGLAQMLYESMRTR
jgi:flagellar protein FlgJ